MTISMATASPMTELDDQPFYLKVAYLVVAITLMGFAQLALRGLSQPLSAPIWVHLHALAMAAWLILFMVQNHLAAAGNFALHRRLGWSAALLTPAIVVLGFITATRAVALHRVPGFAPGYFLGVTMLQIVLFPALVFAAILLRRKTQYHRRLMFGALIISCGSPALTRLPLMGGETGEWITLLLELVLLGVLMRHDRQTVGRVHPATLAVAFCLLVAQLGPSIAGRLPAVNALAAQVAR